MSLVMLRSVPPLCPLALLRMGPAQRRRHRPDGTGRRLPHRWHELTERVQSGALPRQRSEPPGELGDTIHDTRPLPGVLQRGPRQPVGNPLLDRLQSALQPVCPAAMQPVRPLQESKR